MDGFDHETAAAIAQTLKETAGDVKQAHTTIVVPVHGRRWVGVLGFMLANIFFAEWCPLPWLDVEKVNVMPISYYVVLGIILVCATVPIDRLQVRWLRGVSAIVQGFIVGNLMVFDKQTLLFRFSFSCALGFANALDQIRCASLVKKKLIEQIRLHEHKVQPRMGAMGKFKIKNKDMVDEHHEVEVTKVCKDGKCEITFTKKPFWTSNVKTIEAFDVELELTHYSDEAFAKVVKESTGSPGFELRPWGYSFGVTLAQWVTSGFTKGDSFVSGMLSGQALMFLCLPALLWVIWWAWKKSTNPVVRTLCLLLFIGCCTFDFIALLPGTIALTGFSATEVYMHCVVVYISIPISYSIFMWKASKLSMGDIASLGLNHVVRNADRMAPADIKVPLLR